MKIINKLIVYIACLILVVLINFGLPRLMPGDPALMLIGQEGITVTEEMLDEMHQKMGTDKPVITQIALYVQDLMKGDWGFSYQSKKPVSEMLSSSIRSTLIISVPAIIISSVLAILLGCIAGYYQGSSFDNICTSALIILYAVPMFLLGMILVYVFAFRLQWFPLGSLKSVHVEPTFFAAVKDRLWHVFLPIITLSLSSITSKYLIIRNSVAKERTAKYVVYAKARGLSNKEVLFKHILKNSCQPFISVVGMNIGFIFSGSLVVEMIFSLNGMGMLIYNAAINRDYVVMQGAFLLLSLIVILSNLLADLISAMIDPRIRRGTYDGTLS